MIKAKNIDYIDGDKLVNVRIAHITFDTRNQGRYWSFSNTTYSDATHFLLKCYYGSSLHKQFLIPAALMKKGFKIREGSTQYDSFLI